MDEVYLFRACSYSRAYWLDYFVKKITFGIERTNYDLMKYVYKLL